MKNPKIFISPPPHLGGRELKFVQETFRSDDLARICAIIQKCRS